MMKGDNVMIKSLKKNTPAIRKGTAVEMNDGWVGKVECVRDGTVVAYTKGVAPNDWLNGCRAFKVSRANLVAGKALVDWSKKVKPVINLDQWRAGRDRAKREAQWATVN